MKLSIFVVFCLIGTSVALQHEQKELKIVGGADAIENSAPYMISLQEFVPSHNIFVHICGGSIVSENFVLTAGHCVEDNLNATFQVVAGEHNFHVTSGREQKRQVLGTEITVHEHYNRTYFVNDIALMKLLTPLEFIEGIVGKINLPPAGQIPSGDVILFGWGKISDNYKQEAPNILQTVKKDIIPNDICRNVLRLTDTDPILSSTQFCTGPLKKPIAGCFGDSGGPTVHGANDSIELVGVASWIIGKCSAIDTVNGYTRVSAYIDWINQKMEPFIVGGQDAVPHSAPYMISLQFLRRNGLFGHSCGGSIINPMWILSAGHCITLTPREPVVDTFKIIAGQHDLSTDSGNEQVRDVVAWAIHENYTGDVGPNDIAVLRLDTPLIFIVGIVEPVNLPQAGRVPVGDVTLFGWGSISETETAEIPNILQTVVKDIIPINICREILEVTFPNAPLSTTNICTGPLQSRITACSGDSGGPIVQGVQNENLEIVGVASWISAFPCGAINAVTVYVRVSAFIDWINQKIA
ncbi:unnamed protein product [Diamesa hyperborea]